MKSQIITLLFLCASFTSYSQENNKAYAKVYHNLNNISVINFDGTRSSIYINGNSAKLVNADGTYSTINFSGNSSTLIGVDGSYATIFHHGSSSMINNANQTQLAVNHKQRTSSCMTEYGMQVINHFFGNVREKQHADKIDVLIHNNWMLKKKADNALLEVDQTNQ